MLRGSTFSIIEAVWKEQPPHVQAHKPSTAPAIHCLSSRGCQESCFSPQRLRSPCSRAESEGLFCSQQTQNHLKPDIQRRETGVSSDGGLPSPQRELLRPALAAATWRRQRPAGRAACRQRPGTAARGGGCASTQQSCGPDSSRTRIVVPGYVR